MLRRILALAIKEFLVLLKDPKSRFLIIVPPFIQLLVFSFAATFDLSNIPMAVYREDAGPDAQELVADFVHSRHFRLEFIIDHDDQIAPLIDSGQVLLVLRIGPRFSRDLRNRRPASVQAIVDGRDSNTAMITLGYARNIVDRFGLLWARKHGLKAAPARLEARAWFNPNLESRWFIVPGIVGLLTLVITTLVTALSVAREREQGPSIRPWSPRSGPAKLCWAKPSPAS